MTEIVAAHLERVARELALEVARSVKASTIDMRSRLHQEPRIAEYAEILGPILAAALAACAREAEEPLLKALQEVVATLSEFLSWKESQYERRERAIKIAQAALERAVGEKA